MSLRGMLLVASAVAVLACASEQAVAQVNEITGKIIVGYQGWFGCTGDGGDPSFTHWERRDGELSVEMLPDLSDVADKEHDTCQFKPKSGKDITVYSARNPDIVDLHFKWMQDYGISVAAVQRFASVLKNPKRLSFSNDVLRQVTLAAQRHGRSYFVEYDLSGTAPEDGALVLANIEELLRSEVTRNGSYQRLNGRPLIGFYGLGFKGQPWTPQQAMSFLEKVRGSGSGTAIMVGVPAYWRTGTRDASPDLHWLDVWRLAQIISPWTVGRFADAEGAEKFRQDVMTPDIEWSHAAGITYLPTVFPGFSWANFGTGGTRNQIPRRCGSFLREQMQGVRALGLTATFVAMFDEVDEGTAVYKTLPHADGSNVLSLDDDDGCNLTSDGYLSIIKAESSQFASTASSTAAATRAKH